MNEWRVQVQTPLFGFVPLAWPGQRMHVNDIVSGDMVGSDREEEGHVMTMSSGDYI